MNARITVGRDRPERSPSPMSDVDKAFATQLKNIQAKTGKSLDELYALIQQSALTTHGAIRDFLKRELGLGHGDANTLTTFFLKSAASPTPPPAPDPAGDILATIYRGAKAPLRPLHDALMAAISDVGPFELAPKKDYVSLRRKKQFAMIGPATQTRVEVGLNMKDVPPTDRLIALPAGGMCQYKVIVTQLTDVDAELLAWIRHAYDRAG
jgi:hypothetical protein